MDRERWRRLQPILDEVLDLPADERRRRLDVVCAADAQLRAEVEAFLRADAETRGVLDGISSAFFKDALDDAGNASRRAERQSEDHLLPGVRVAARYRIVSLLGRGGMGEVYRADDLKLGQPVALKFLPRDLQQDGDYLHRLLGETKLARQVAHPNVCRVYDIGEWHERHFLSMEYIDGEDLASLIKRIGHLPRQKALDIARQLCAGLDAAHQLGILHRDLKPANVMLDGRGQIRITDFGLAVAAALKGREARAGTPGYMAPEQLEGREATTRSDVYALGLVLYELFTGRRAFPAATLQELQRLQEESSPTHPSALVEGFDPVIERAILRCLEKDSELRPASAREVATLLPGGDPLAAAIAAGETPSPEIIAASGPAGALRPATAFGILGATLAMLAVLMLLSDRASVVGWVSWPRSADALDDNARGILARLGHDAKPVDRAAWFFFNFGWMGWVHTHDASSTRWEVLRDPGQFGILYFYRQAPYPLVPLGRNGWVSDSDPVPRSGDVRMLTDLRGRLIWLLALPPDAEQPIAAARGADWSRLFDEAGLDIAEFRPVAPTRNPHVTSDERAAWTGVLKEFGDYPTRVEAAAHRGRPVYFELVVPWDPYWDPSRATFAWTGPPPVYLVAILVAVVFTGLLAVRNWMSGRGDRHGAFRVAAVVFGFRCAVWVLGGHHVPSADGQWMLLLVAVGKSLTDAAAMWCFYMALEPQARRLHPRLLVSWTRLLRGRMRDPLVGRDILHGVALGTLVILLWGQLYVLIPHALRLPAPPSPVPNPMGGAPFMYLLDSPPHRALLGGRYVLEALPALALRALSAVLIWTMMLLGWHLLLRKAWAAVGAFVILGSMLAWPTTLTGFDPISFACSITGTLVLVWALRFGLVGILSLWFCVAMWMNFPITAKLDAPHFSTGLVAILAIAALGAYGAFVASRPRRASPAA